jgi:hypothetical protein
MTAIVLQDKEITSEFIDVYYEFLKDIDEKSFIESMKECIKTRRFFPTIAEIRERAEPFIKEKKRTILTLPDNYDDIMREEDKKRRDKKGEEKKEEIG